MEHVVLSHMAKINIIIDQQHDFRQRFSCDTQLITICDWAKSINVRSQTGAILPDFSKAFDLNWTIVEEICCQGSRRSCQIALNLFP